LWHQHRMVVGWQPYAPAAFTPQEILVVLISVGGWVNPRATVIYYSSSFFLKKKNCLARVSSVKISGVKSVVYFKVKIKCCPHILHFASEHKIHDTSLNESHTLFRGINEFKPIPSPHPFFNFLSQVWKSKELHCNFVLPFLWLENGVFNMEKPPYLVT